MSLAAFNLGFDIGAFNNVDYRKILSIWVLSTIALVSSFVFRRSDYHLGGRWRFVLLIPSLWVVADFIDTSDAIVLTLLVASVATLPLTGYILVYLIAGDFIKLSAKFKIVLVMIAVGIFALSVGIGHTHPRFLSCNDFAKAGDYTPENCTP